MNGLISNQFLYVLVALLVIVDPAGTAVVFAAMTARDSRADRSRLAKRACGIAFIVLSLFGVAGEHLLHLLGIGLPALKVAGGILLFLAAAEMVTSRGETRAARAEPRAAARSEDISVFPLAIPLIAGPGAMTTMVLFQSTGHGDPFAIAASEAALVVVLAITLAAMLAANRMARLLGRTGANVVSRVFGVLLAALAAQIALDGLRQSLWP
jgi:multiple antibiotic resistance protein